MAKVTTRSTSSATDTTRTTRAQKGAIAETMFPQPMLCHSDNTIEAANSVANVLWFMACALREGFDFAGDEKLLDGAGLILETCADTLSFHLTTGKKGGAA